MKSNTLLTNFLLEQFGLDLNQKNVKQKQIFLSYLPHTHLKPIFTTHLGFK